MNVYDHEKIYEMIGTADTSELCICPNYESELQIEQYGRLFVFYCPNGDFMTDLAPNSICTWEALEGLRWVRKKRRERR